MNNITILGRLVREHEVKQVGNDTTMLKNCVAVDRRFAKDGQQKTDFINIVSFGKTAEVMEQYTGKGNRVCLSGRLQIDQFQNKEGDTKHFTNIVVESFSFVDSLNDNKGDAYENENKEIYDDVDDTEDVLPF